MSGSRRMRCGRPPPLNAMWTAPHAIHLDGFPRRPFAGCRRVAAVCGQTSQELRPCLGVGVISNHGLEVDRRHRVVVVGTVWLGMEIRELVGCKEECQEEFISSLPIYHQSMKLLTPWGSRRAAHIFMTSICTNQPGHIQEAEGRTAVH